MDTTAKKSGVKKWILGILLLILVGGLTTLIIIGYYRSQFKLTQERLDEARQKWKENKLLNYDLEMEVSGDVSHRIKTKVRKGKVEEVIYIRDTAAGVHKKKLVRRAQQEANTVEGLFNQLEEFLEVDAKEPSLNASNYAEFDATYGYLVNYVRSAGKQNIEMKVKVYPVSP